MVVLLAGVAFVVYRLIKGKSQSQPTSPLSYAGAGNTGNASAPLPQAQPAQFTGNAAAPGSLAATVGGAPVGSSAAPISVMAQKRWPADFDAAAFERQAIIGFNRLQAANDAGDATTLRDFLTPELYSELEAEMKSSWGSNQKTEAVNLKAEVLEVVTEGSVYVASVKFSGQISENGVVSPLNEMWHMEKPVNGSSGWRVAGIQQVS
jgi:predicted lipid-binding transport protein (Tim44 family)